MLERDVAAVYRLLANAGVRQRALAALTGQSQSEVSEIVAGRRVVSVDVLERIAVGLGTPLSWWRLAGADERGDVARLTVLVDAAQTDIGRLTAMLEHTRTRAARQATAAHRARNTTTVLQAQITALAAMLDKARPDATR